MRLTAPLGFLSILLFSLSVAAQQPASPQPVPQPAPERDSQAVAVLTQCLGAVGGQAAIAAIQDFTGTGTITYFWAGEQVSGPATVRGRGSDQFRLDANLPQGTRSYAVSHGHGSLREVTGKISEIPYHNTVNVGILTFPYSAIATALRDPLTSVAYVGLVEISGRQAHQVRLARHLSPSQDPADRLSRLMIADYFVDAASSLLVQVSDKTHPVESSLKDYPHEIELADYRNINGVNIPLRVQERFMGQLIWELRLTEVTFSAGLTDSDFSLD
jgi:hypothetical protein